MLGGYIVLYPRARVLTLIFIIFFVTIVEIPAVYLLGFWFVEQLYFGAAGLTSAGSGGSGIAYFAHVGGFAFGLLTMQLLAPRPDCRRSVRCTGSRAFLVLAAAIIFILPAC